MSNPIEHIRAVMVAAGPVPPDNINADGGIHRYNTTGKPSHKNDFFQVEGTDHAI